MRNHRVIYKKSGAEATALQTLRELPIVPKIREASGLRASSPPLLTRNHFTGTQPLPGMNSRLPELLLQAINELAAKTSAIPNRNNFFMPQLIPICHRSKLVASYFAHG